MSNPIFLVGLMGSGKTTVGRKLANLLDRGFVDTDQELIQRTGVSIAHIFEVEGEEGFRRRETRLLDELAKQSGLVIATGGGIATRPENRDIMSRSGTVVFLDAPMSVLWCRLKDCQHRPLLQVENPRERIEALREERTPAYLSIADLRVEVSSDSAVRTARRIKQSLIKHNEDR